MSQHVFIIAEAGVNHNGSLERALLLVEAAAAAGADAVKFQTFKADRLVSRAAPKAAYQIENTGSDETQHEMIRKLELDEAAHQVLQQHCRQTGIEFLSTPFDLESLDMLVSRFDLSLVKLASGEISNAPFLLAAARTGKPVILSTGMSDLGDVENALAVLAFGYTVHESEVAPSLSAFKAAYCSENGQSSLKDKVRLLHCTTEYPAPLADVNLRAMETMRRAFGLPVGYSDHTEGITIPVAAAALGATVIEKHFTLDRNLPGPDHKASLEPDELAQMVHAIRQVEDSLGAGCKAPSPVEFKNRPVARKSLVAARAIAAGEIFSLDNLAVKRPGNGISPMHYWDWLGKPAARPYATDELIAP